MELLIGFAGGVLAMVAVEALAARETLTRAAGWLQGICGRSF